ncbi:hypothetical protein LTR56_016134 [Elasticomyces elasticus]|nr:hypothetical protein LTR56_016134 [Elasticomyces elasticus]KAK3637922.1 hypothetical protein LTR22_018060 [Elasticomyces elasticus]KAK5762739.1 hypothetical protein LTS12_007128 [Elasticomyces elasticus]
MEPINSTDTVTDEVPTIPDLPDIGASSKSMWWLIWLLCVLLIRFFMVERKYDGARFGLVGCITGAMGRMNEGEDEEWAALYHEIRDSTPPVISDQTGHTDTPGLDSPSTTKGSSGPEGPEFIKPSIDPTGLAVGDARVGKWQIFWRKRLWARLVVDLFSWHRMYWFGPCLQGEDDKVQQSRHRLGTGRNRYGDRSTSSIVPANVSDLTLVYGTQSVTIEEGNGQLDDFSRDKRWKAQRYGFYFLLLGSGLCIRSWQSRCFYAAGTWGDTLVPIIRTSATA